MDNFSYVIGDESTKECMIVDPGWEADKLVNAAEGYKIIGILITHTHYDHIQELDNAIALTKAAVYVHASGVGEIAKYLPKDYASNGKVKLIKENYKIKIGKLTVKVMHTPGHNPSCVSFLVENKLITGDTLFVESCGRCDLLGSDVLEQWESLQKLKKLDDNIEVYTGHDYGSKQSSTIGYEKKNNPYLKCKSKEEFISDRMH